MGFRTTELSSGSVPDQFRSLRILCRPLGVPRVCQHLLLCPMTPCIWTNLHCVGAMLQPSTGIGFFMVSNEDTGFAQADLRPQPPVSTIGSYLSNHCDRV